MFKVLSATITFLAIQLASIAQPVIEHYNFSDSIESAQRVKNKIIGSHTLEGVMVYDLDLDLNERFTEDNSIFSDLRVCQVHSDFSHDVWLSYSWTRPGHGAVKYDGEQLESVMQSYFGIDQNTTSDQLGILDITPDSAFIIHNNEFIYHWKNGVRSTIFEKRDDCPAYISSIVFTDSLFHYGPYFLDLSIMGIGGDTTILKLIEEYPRDVCRDGNTGIYFSDRYLKRYDDGVTTILPKPFPNDQFYPRHNYLTLDKNGVLWGIARRVTDNQILEGQYLIKYFGDQPLSIVNMADLGFEDYTKTHNFRDLKVDAFNNLVITHEKGVSLYNEHGVLGINKPTNPFTIQAYPNPSKEGFTVQLNVKSNGQYLLLNAHGQQLSYGTIQPDSTFEIPKQAPGIYFLTVIVKGSSQTIKLVQQ